MKIKSIAFWPMAVVGSLGFISAFAAEFHVSLQGSDLNSGSPEKPLRSIQAAAERAQPGDIITVHAGVYRERVSPPRGGVSPQKPITYQAAPGERALIKGSEVITNWAKTQNDVWKVTLPNEFFGKFNPYSDLIHGDWFDPRGREHHTGAVYLNGEWLMEAPTRDALQATGKIGLWFAEVNTNETTIWAQFPGVNPNKELVEINVRRTVFYPGRSGINYITVRGFTLTQAATPWAPPTAEQIGLIGTHWSKGWIIESNTVTYSTCSGIALGKYGDEWDNTSANTAEGYVKTIERALANGWNKETIGHHIVRNNMIAHCEQAGIVGSLGAAFSSVTGNEIHDIHVRGRFSGAEMAGIKFHAAIDTTIQGNHIYRTCRGLWLDWMAQGTRVTANLLHQNASEDLFVEVNHGPFLADNNLFLSTVSLLDVSEGGSYAHNLFAGRIISHPEPNRQTPYHPPHTTAVAGLLKIRGGDNRFFNNIFVGPGIQADKVSKNENASGSTFGLCVYNPRELPLRTGGNVYYNGAQPYTHETNALTGGQISKPRLVQNENEALLDFGFEPELSEAQTTIVTTGSLGKTMVSNLAIENPDGSSLVLNKDYFGHPRNVLRPSPGPFEKRSAEGFRVWPRN